MPSRGLLPSLLWHRFDRDSRSARDVKGLLDAHRTYLDTTLRRCLVIPPPPSPTVWQVMEDVLAPALEVCQMLAVMGRVYGSIATALGESKVRGARGVSLKW